MASQRAQATGDASPQGQRARRIPDAEWNVWREKPVRLHLEDDASRKEIVETMAKDHNFVINETQLKHRFQKWDIKKYINDEDMTKILALERKRLAIGKDIRFQYKGHDIEQERTERAYKRQKRELRSPTTAPSYIKVYASRHQSPQHPTDLFAVGSNSLEDPAKLPNPCALNAGLRDFQSLEYLRNPGSPSNLISYVDISNPAIMGFVQAGEISHDTIMADAPDLPFD